MAATAAFPLTTAAREPARSSFLTRVMDALVASRMRAAAREIRRYEALTGESVRVHRDVRATGLGRTDRLPFTA